MKNDTENMEGRKLLSSQSVYAHHEPIIPREYKRSKTLTPVDWKLLLAFNPPPGYRPCSDSGNLSKTGSDIRDDREDKVLAILRNILRDLEHEIREDKKRLKREERRRRRQELVDIDVNKSMSQSGSRRLFRTSSPMPLYLGSSDDKRATRKYRSPNGYADDDLSFVSVNSLSRIEEVPRLRRTGSSLGSDWSRHSREPLDETEVEPSVRSELDTTSTTETVTDFELSVEVGENSFESGSTTPTSGISRAKTSYVNGDVQQKFRNGYIRTMDVRKRRLVFRKQMDKFDILPSHNADVTRSDRTDTLPDDSVNGQDQPFSVSKLLSKPSYNHSPSSQTQLTTELNKSHDRLDTENSKNNDNIDNVPLQLDHTHRGANVIKTQTELRSKRTEETEAPKQTSNNINNNKKPIPPKKPVRNKLRKNNSESSLENSPTVSMTESDLWRREGGDSSPSRTVRPPAESPSPGRNSRRMQPIWIRSPRARNEIRLRPDAERSHSGTSGYSTDEYSYKTSDSEEEEAGYDDVTVKKYREQLNKYFMVLRGQEKMAVVLDDNQVPAGDAVKKNSLSLTNSVSMSDLAIPDHVGWIIHQSEQRKMWGVVVDMLFCIFESQENDKPEEVILLPGCNIRPLVFKTAINGLHTRKPAKTITGIAKYQIVIDNASTRKKHLFGLESAAELDTWYSILKRASALDPESTNEMAGLSRQSSISSTTDIGSDELKVPKTGYTPSKDSMSRAQKLSNSSIPSPRSESPTPSQSSFGERCNSPSFYNQNGGQPSPRGQPVVRHDSRRHSIQDIKKHLRREQDQETSKNQPVKAHHFVPQVSEPVKEIPEKKLRSFGSFESLLKFKKKRKKKKSLSEDSNDDTGSVISTSSIEGESTSQSIDISASSSKLKKTKRLSRSLDAGDSKKGSNGLVRRASDIKDKVFPKRGPKPKPSLGELTDVSIHGFLYHKHHLKWHKLWCTVCRGFFYGFKSQAPSENAQLSVVLANCAVVYVTRKDKRDKHLYVFKLSQEGKRSIYLCSSDYRELQQWLTVLQMESNSVLVNAEELRPFGDSENESIGSSFSSPNGSILNVHANIKTNANNTESSENSRSRSKKKKQAPPKPPRHSSCPPSVSRDPAPTQTGSESSATDETGRNGSISSQSESASMYGSQDDIPQHDKALVHVWQNDRGYLFNVIRAKLTAYRARKSSGDIYNQDLTGFNNEGLLVVQDASKRKALAKDGKKERRKALHKLWVDWNGSVDLD